MAFLYLRGKLMKIFQSRHGWLPSLERKVNGPSRIDTPERLLQQLVNDRRLHNPSFFLQTIISLVFIKAILAAQITKTGCRFHQEIQKFHIVHLR